MSIAAIWHFSWTVSDLQRSVDYYVNELNFELIHTLEITDHAIAQLVGLADAHIKAALLKPPGSTKGTPPVELVEYVHPRGEAPRMSPHDTGNAHIALVTDELPALYTRLHHRGTAFVSPPVRITTGRFKGGLVCYSRDPDNFIIELVQLPPNATV